MLPNENKIFVLLCIFFDAWTRFLSAIMSKYRVSLDLKLVISMKIMTINILIINDWVIICSINQPPQISLILFLCKLSAKKLMYVTSPIFSRFGQVFQNFWKSRSFSYMCFSPWYSHYLSLIAFGSLCKESKEFDMPKWRKVWKGKFGPIWEPDFRPRFSGWRSEYGQNLIKGI